ncbi:MAG: DUF4174 domain-containing protein [Bacteroidota bacterium]
MKYLRGLIIIPFLSMLTTTCAQDLSEHRWQDRLIIILAEDADDPTFLQQVAEFKREQAALQERRLLVYQVLPNRYRQGLDSSTAWTNSSALYEQFSTAQAPFQVLLIGLDGGVKLRQQTPVSREDIFDLIDTMPIRRAEMRRKKGLK